LTTNSVFSFGFMVAEGGYRFIVREFVSFVVEFANLEICQSESLLLCDFELKFHDNRLEIG